MNFENANLCLSNSWIHRLGNSGSSDLVRNMHKLTSVVFCYVFHKSEIFRTQTRARNTPGLVTYSESRNHSAEIEISAVDKRKSTKYTRAAGNSSKLKRKTIFDQRLKFFEISIFGSIVWVKIITKILAISINGSNEFESYCN